MSWKYLIISTLIAITIASCGKGKSIQAIPIEDVEDTYFLDEITDSRSYVLLDDSSLDAIVGDITQVMVDDGLIFVSHIPNAKGNDIDQIISVYDKEGRYLNKIGQKGRARNEFLRIRSWCIDKDNKEVLMYDLDAYAIKKYTYDGTFIPDLNSQRD
ncbi:MAG: 6-bladed beta-propeller [Bacteroidaceae bacterium]